MNTQGGILGAVADDLLSEFNNDAVVNNTINGGRRGQGVFEDLVPLGKDQVGGDDDATAFIAFGEQGEEHLHLVARLLDVAYVIEDQHIKAVEAAKFLFEE